MDTRKSCILVAFFVLLLSMDAIFVEGDTNNNGNNGNGNNGNGNGNNNNNNNGNNNNNDVSKETDYDVLSPTATGEERSHCKAKGACYSKTLVCPSQCPEKKPKQNKKKKGCYVDCSSKCEVTCKCKHPLPITFITFLYITIRLYLLFTIFSTTTNMSYCD